MRRLTSSAIASTILLSGLTVGACKTVGRTSGGGYELSAITDAKFPNIDFNTRSPYVSNNTVILTFDDGPDQNNTARVLDTLKNKKVKASFFINSDNYSNLTTEPAMRALVKRMINEGHELGNHTEHHSHLSTLSGDAALNELTAVEKVVASIMGESSHPLTLIRAPYGDPFQGKSPETFDAKATEIASVIGTKGVHIGWGIDGYEDNCGEDDSNCVYNNLINQLQKPGAGSYGVILLHSVHNSTATMLPRLIDYLNANGFVIKTTEDIVRAKYGKSSKEVILGGASPSTPSTGVAPAGTVANPVPGQTYSIVSRYSGRCLDNKDGSKDVGTPYQQWECNANNPNQLFTLRSAADSTFTLVNKVSGQCLDLAATSGVNGSKIIQKPCADTTSQKLNFVSVTGSANVIKMNAAKACLDIDGPSLNNMAAVHVWQCYTQASQQWFFVKR